MKTEDLINALVQDARQQRSIAERVFIATLLGALFSGTLFALTLGVRSDFGTAIETWRFVLKCVLCLICVACAWSACLELARPEVRLRDVIGRFALVPTILAGAVVYELNSTPQTLWYERAAGNYAGTCMIAIPLLSIIPLAALLVALRAGAPRVPASTGAVAGFLASSLAAALYATHCPDDSPLFVSVWYSLAVGMVTLIGALAGHRLLRW